ncbi:MAG: hypothetical protein Athens071425_134 [Parcubacteria group bacterium Athens0714_25]|nr:MAG: hypothetical protein Athens071425_134 [Parcubacteria group bacterium Athens0714_25]
MQLFVWVFVINLEDRFGLSWQIVPDTIEKMLRDQDKTERVMGAVLKMKKINMVELQKAYDGE